MEEPMSECKNLYFTAGELAEMFHMPKQTFLYYTKLGLIEPEFTAENQYRYYSLKQYLILEIIVNMRKLDIPIHKIREYLKERSPENLCELLTKRKNLCDEIINNNLKIKSDLEVVLNQIKKAQSSHLNQINLNYRKEKYFYITDNSSSADSKESVKNLARHNMALYSKKDFKDRALGWVISKEDFFQNDSIKALYFFTAVGRPDNEQNPKYHKRPAGLYLTVRFKGKVIVHQQRLKEMICDFCRKNELQVIGDIYMIQLKNCWMTDDPQEYINQISVQVEQNSK